MLYACCQTAPTKLMDELKPLLRGADYRWQTLGSEPVKDRLIYLAVGYDTLKPHLKDLDERKVAIIVFDSPLRLFDIEPDVWLDSEKPELSYRFPLTGGLRLERLNRMVDRLVENKETAVSLKRRKIDLLPRLLEEMTPTGFLEIYNAYLLASTGPDNRTSAQEIIGKVLFEGGSIKKMATALAHLTPGEAAEGLIDRLVEAFKSKEGERVLKACDRLGRNEKLQPRKVAEQENCDPNTIRYLVKAQKRESAVEEEETVAALDEAGRH